MINLFTLWCMINFVMEYNVVQVTEKKSGIVWFPFEFIKNVAKDPKTKVEYF